MPELYFQVRGERGVPLEIVIRKTGKNLTATCACSAGVDDICQHRITLLSGSSKDVISNNPEDVKKVVSWIAGTDVGKALQDMVDAIKQLENAREDFADARKRLIKALKD
ncbi:MAG: hypothetical protein HQL97_08575 [Magnetococcales bacterium]|nr:hypothetical protein [Magnetococcales bacterium]MBF0261871.1 hypothetical protein [Magnetococcales bacterium]